MMMQGIQCSCGRYACATCFSYVQHVLFVLKKQFTVAVSLSTISSTVLQTVLWTRHKRTLPDTVLSKDFIPSGHALSTFHV